MLDATKLTLFLITAFVILVTPGHATLQMVILGMLFVVMGIFNDGALGVTLAVSGQSRKQSRRPTRS